MLISSSSVLVTIVLYKKLLTKASARLFGMSGASIRERGKELVFVAGFYVSFKRG